MKKTVLNLLPSTLLVIVIGAYFLLQGWTTLPSQNQMLRLPGAKQSINAGAYSSLQDAIDALSDEGGLVNIPPGVNSKTFFP